MTNYEAYIQRKVGEYGDKFDADQLARKFIPAFNSEERIRVKFQFDKVRSGTIGVTTGWRPSFMLMLTSRSRGSSHLLSDTDEIVPNSTPIKRY